MEEEEELGEIRRKRMLELQARAQEQQRQEELKAQYEIQKKLILQQILTPEARSRLANIRAARPEFAEQLELQLVQLAKTGRIGSRITDTQLREILNKLHQKRRDIKIRRM